MPKTAKLALEDGTVFTGTSFGADGEVDGEVCFNTSMTGYQEILTDPSYRGQIVTMTYPQIGNYGVNAEDVESRKPHLAGFIVRENSRRVSNFRADGDLDGYLKHWGIVGMEGIDTRSLVRRLRICGAMKSVLSSVDLDDARLVARAKASPGLVGRDLVREVIPDGPIEWTESLSRWAKLHGVEYPEPGPGSPHVVALDYGMKWNIARHLFSMGCRVTILPGTATADDVLAHKPDGVFLSNGPGDPGRWITPKQTIRGLLGKKPIFGICLGHQLLALACGGEDLQAQVRPPRRQPAGDEQGDRPGRDHHAEPRLFGRGELAARRVGSDPRKPERPDDRGPSPPQASGVLRPVSPRSQRRPARQQLSVRPVPGDAAVVVGTQRLQEFLRVKRSGRMGNLQQGQ